MLILGQNLLPTFLRAYSQCSEVERELGLLFSKGGKQRNQSKQSGASMKFQMLVEDVQEGVLVRCFI